MGGSLNYSVPAPDDVPMGANYAVPAPDDPNPGYPIYERSALGKFLHTAGQTGVFGLLGYAATRNVEQPKEQKLAKGFWQSAEAGYQSSASSLVTTGRRPDIVLDSEHAKWYEKLANMGGQVVGDFPAMVLGAAGGGAVASETGPVGASVAAGAGALAVPTAIRTSLMEAYEKGEVTSLADFLLRTNVVMKATNVAAISGGLMGAAGAKTTQILTPVANEAVIAGTRSATGARLGVNLASAGAEAVVQPVSAALMEGRLPEPEEFLDAGVLIAGVRGARHVAGKMTKIYAKTGVGPVEAAAMAKLDAAVSEGLKTSQIGDVVVYHGTEKAFSVEDFKTGDFTSNRDRAQNYAGMDGKSGTIIEARLDIKNPMPWGQAWNMTPADIKAAGFDGTIHRGDSGEILHARVVDPSQIKPVSSIAEALKADDLELPEPFREMANQQAAVDAVPGLAPEVAKEFFGPPVRVAGEPEPTQINYKYLDTPDTVNGALKRMSELNLEEIQKQRRGIVPWEQTQHEAGKALKEMLGAPDDFLAKREPGTPAGAAELLARKQMVEGAANNMMVEATKLNELPETATVEQRLLTEASFLTSIDTANLITAEFLGARAEAGRALNILKETNTSAQRAKAVQELLARYGKSPAELAEMMAKLNDPAAVLKMAKVVEKATTYDMIVEAWKAGLVSGPVTQVANVMGNTSFMAMRPAVDAVAAGFGMFSSAPDRVRMVEPLARIYGDLHGVMDGLKVAKAAFLMDAPGGKAEHMQAIPGKAGTVIRTPFRALAAGDALFRVMTERGEAYALASRQATIEGHNLATAEFRNRVAELVNNPTDAMQKEIKASGQRFTFNAKLGEKGRAVQQFVKSWHLQFAVPFIATPGNVFKEMARLTPFAPIVGEWREAVFGTKSANPKDWVWQDTPAAHKAMAEVALGTGLSALTMSLAIAGHVSGAGDPDPNKRRVAQAAGWQPYSIKINGTWHSYQRFQPVGTLLGLAADMAEVWEHLDEGESDAVPKILATAFANSVTNQSFLQGFSMVVEAFSQPDRELPRLAQNLAASAVPALVGQTAQMLDPYQREISSIREAVQNRIPGARENLTPTRDPFGEPIASPDRMGWISPITTKDQSTDKVRTEAARLGIGEGKAPKSISLPAGGLQDIGNVPLSPEQRDVFGDVAGHKAHEILTQLVNSPGWEHMPDDFQKKAYRLVFEKAHQAGKAAALTDEQRQVEIQRILGEVAERLKP